MPTLPRIPHTPGMKNESIAYKLGRSTGLPSRLLLFGFLLAREGVGVVPRHNTAALLLTVAAGVIACLPDINDEKWRGSVATVRLVAVFACMNVVLHMDAPTTSMLLIGACVMSLVRLADNVPFIYGILAGVAVYGWVPQLHSHKFGTAGNQMILSGKPWSPERAGHEALLLAGFMFLTVVLKLTNDKARRYKQEKDAAETARDAAVADERARIARELHDVVSHHVTAMTLQAEAAAMTGNKEALSAVATEGREALTELRRMLGVLRHPDDGDATALTPQPGLDGLDELGKRVSTGPAVRVTRDGEVRPLSAGLELGVYRLVQEALTNAAKHGDATTVDVVLTYGSEQLTVDITDDGRPLAAARVGSGGLGLVGMSERIALLNGSLETGPRTDTNGYRVHAVLPIDA